MTFKTEMQVWEQIDKCKYELDLLNPECVADDMAIDYYNDQIAELELKLYDFMPCF